MYVHSTTKLSPYLVPSIFIELYGRYAHMQCAALDNFRKQMGKSCLLCTAHVPI